MYMNLMQHFFLIWVFEPTCTQTHTQWALMPVMRLSVCLQLFGGIYVLLDKKIRAFVHHGAHCAQLLLIVRHGTQFT